MKYICRWLYKRFVNELYVPEYQTFSIGMAETGSWQSYLPDTLTLHIKTKEGVWQQTILKR